MTGSRSRERSSTESGSSTVPAAGSGSGGSGGSGAGGWSGKKEEKTGLDTSKTLRGESAIALRYRRRLARQGEQS